MLAAVLAVLIFAVSAFWIRVVSWFFMEEPLDDTAILVTDWHGATAAAYVTWRILSTAVVAWKRHWTAWLAPFGAVLLSGFMVSLTKTGYPSTVFVSFAHGLVLTWLIGWTIRRQSVVQSAPGAAA